MKALALAVCAGVAALAAAVRRAARRPRRASLARWSRAASARMSLIWSAAISAIIAGCMVPPVTGTGLWPGTIEARRKTPLGASGGCLISCTAAA